MPQRRDREHGAVAVLVAILAVALIGFAALAVDLGASWSDRRQLQNGADAAALAIGQDCASGYDGCAEENRKTTAQTLAAANKNDGSVIGTITSFVQSGASGEVTVVASTTRQHWFAPVLGTEFQSSDIGTEAKVVWGPVGGGASIPLTISWCDFETYMGGWKPGDPYPDEEQTIVLPQTPADATTCEAPYGGKDVPGGFGWVFLSGPATCEVTTVDGTKLYSSSGDKIPNKSCEDLLVSLRDQTVLVPIYGEEIVKDPTAPPSTGGNSYIIFGYAAFHITGYDFKGSKDLKWNPPTDPACTSKNQCISGYFTGWSSTGGDVAPGGTDLGARVVSLVLE